MRFSYVERESEPLPGVPGSEVEWLPMVTVRVAGPGRVQLVPGLVDTGASLTLIPGRYFERLGAIQVGNIGMVASGVEFQVRLARVDLELRTTRTTWVWSALVGFSSRREYAVWGQLGFLEHFTATFNTHRRFLNLHPNGTFPGPLHVQV